ncbi:caspase, EACC1-associated type [Blastococcus sp. PRF04-17]|uniref:caspase, EACC1-associated type n=1 Tax=Blastococcus sp. PRF04-17 TaxID=2933797 RepID=UPI002739E385|nr:caspase family protein [Blastococcus sp. PRF04-17]
MTPVSATRKALIVATYEYTDAGLRRLAAPEHDAESLAAVLEDPGIADFDVTTLVNQPHHVVGEAIADFYADARRDDLTLLYFTGHGLKDDEGRFYLAMTNTRRSALMFTAISGAQLNDAMDESPSRRKVLVLDCCYSGAFPAGRTAKADEGVQTLERFQGKGRAVLTASDATQYAFEGDDLKGRGVTSVFTRYLVEAIRSGEADLDEDGDIALDELYSYVRERVVAEVPGQRPKKQEDVDGRILIARNVHWTLPDHLRHAIESPIAAQRLTAVEGLGHLHRTGNEVVRAAVRAELAALAADDSRSVSAAATEQLGRLGAAPSAPSVPAPRPYETPAVPVVAAAAPLARPDPPPPQAIPVRDAPPVEPRPVAPDPSPVVAGAPAPPPGAPAGRTRRWARPDRVLALVLLSALPLTLFRLLYFETSYPHTADSWTESTLPWTVFVVLPLVAAAGLLAARSRVGWALPVAAGLLLGAGLVLVEHALFWIFFFTYYRDSYTVGAALWFLVLGAVVVVAAAVVILSRPPLAGRPGARADWRVACALVVVACVLWFLASGPETHAPSYWLAVYEGTFLLGGAALAVTLLWLSSGQRVAALVGITLFGLWSVYWIVRELQTQDLGIEEPVLQTELIGVLLTLLACYAAQIGPARQPAATSPPSR